MSQLAGNKNSTGSGIEAAYPQSSLSRVTGAFGIVEEMSRDKLRAPLEDMSLPVAK